MCIGSSSHVVGGCSSEKMTHFLDVICFIEVQDPSGIGDDRSRVRPSSWLICVRGEVVVIGRRVFIIIAWEDATLLERLNEPFFCHELESEECLTDPQNS